MLTIKEACKYLKLSQRTIYRLIKSGALKAKRVGWEWRFELQDIDKFTAHKTTVRNVAKPLMMSLQEVCVFLGVTRYTIYRLIESRKLPAVKSGGRWKFPDEAVRRFLTKNRNVPAYVRGINPEGGVLDLNQTAQLLGVDRRTIYRLIKEGKLSATKVAGVWRFIRTELSRYLLDRKYEIGTFAVKGAFFRPDVLNKYRKDAMIYYIKDNAYDGLVGSKQDYTKYKQLRNHPYYKLLKKKKMHPPLFSEVHYRKIGVKGGYVLALTPEQYRYLPPEEYGHWAEFIIPDAQVAQMQL